MLDLQNPDLAAVLPDAAGCAARIRPLFQAADVHLAFPSTSAIVCEVLRAGGGYDVTAEKLDSWAAAELLGKIRNRGSGFEWSPENILAAVIHCETWRRWLPLDRRHLAKMTAIEMAEQQARANGGTAFSDLEKFDVQSLAIMLERLPEPEIRHAVRVGLMSKLANLGVDL